MRAKILIATLLLAAGCAALPKETLLPSRRIATAAGPEDIELAPDGRIIISCYDHRCEGKCPNGDILALTPASGQVDTLTRTGEPAGMVFRPHGIAIATLHDSTFLFAISHDNPNHHHFVAQYHLGPGGLRWVRNVESEHFRSPNALTVTPEGLLFVSNDHWNRDAFSELLFKKRVCTLVRSDLDGHAAVVADKIQYGNGITYRDGTLYQAATTGNSVYAYPVTAEGVGERRRIAKVKGADNLRWDGGTLLVACHLRNLAFIRHMKDGAKHAPSTIYRLDPSGAAKPQLVFHDRGDAISANSTGLIVGGKLYIAQVFEPYLLEVNLEARP